MRMKSTPSITKKQSKGAWQLKPTWMKGTISQEDSTEKQDHEAERMKTGKQFVESLDSCSSIPWISIGLWKPCSDKEVIQIVGFLMLFWFDRTMDILNCHRSKAIPG